MSEQSSHDEALRDLAIRQARSGQIEGARQTALQITDKKMQRWAWIRILYTQFFRLEALEDVRSKEARENLRAMKETLALLSDDSLWYGSYVTNLLPALVKAGDSVGAIEIVGRMNNPVYRLIHYGDIADCQARNNDPEGVEQTLSVLSKDPDRLDAEGIDMLDLVLGRVQKSLHGYEAISNEPNNMPPE